VLGSNPAGSAFLSGVTRAVMVTRINTMEPSSSENLKRFFDSYEVCKSYILAFGFPVGQEMVMARENQLLKQQLIVREAWEIGPYDIDVVAIHEDDNPIIPDGQKDAPVLRALQRRCSGS
jgi:hypothetical protein